MTRRRKARIRFLLIAVGLAVLAAIAVVFVVVRPGHRAPLRSAGRATTSAGAASSRARRRASSAAGSGTRATPAPGAAGRRSQPPSTGGIDRSLGQMIVARFAGPQPARAVLQRIRRGQIGGVILFADNLSPDPTRTKALTTELQSAARQGGNPPLLIMTDQEGGAVRRVPGPPAPAPDEMTTTTSALRQGRATGTLLRSLGINLDLAPVADVEAVDGSFLGTRAFGHTPAVVADRACSFARGLASAGVGYTLKHFPGLGRATTSTDDGPVSIDDPAESLRADYLAYRRCAASPRALVMISSAAYPALTGPVPAVMSPLTYHRELPTATGRSSVPTISDDLEAPAFADQPTPARTSIQAGLDMAMYARTEQGSAEAYHLLAQDLRGGRISPPRVRAAAQAVLRLKRAVAGG